MKEIILISRTKELDSTRTGVLGINTSLHLTKAATRKVLLDPPGDLHRVMQDQKAAQKVATLEGTAVTNTRRQVRRAMKAKIAIPRHQTRKMTQENIPDESGLVIPSRSRTVAARTDELAPVMRNVIEKVALDGLQNI